MAANTKFQVRRTSVSGRTPNTTASYATNSQYIAAGEFALNMSDGILYTSDGTNLITVGANITSQRITNSLTLNNDKNIYFQTVNTSAFVAMRQQTDDNFVFYSTNTAYGQRAIWSIFANSITSAFSLSVPTTFNGNITLGGVAVSANGSTGTAGQVLTTNGSSAYWSTVSGGGSGTPGGSNTQIQFNNSGSFGGDANLTFDKTTAILTISNTISIGNSTVNTDIIASGIIFNDGSILNTMGQIVALYNNLAMA
jgi:hypothetical protein